MPTRMPKSMQEKQPEHSPGGGIGGVAFGSGSGGGLGGGELSSGGGGGLCGGGDGLRSVVGKPPLTAQAL